MNLIAYVPTTLAERSPVREFKPDASAMNYTHLEFSFHLATCNLGTAIRTVTNPFTGKPRSSPIDKGLNSAECEQLRAVISSHEFVKSDIPGEGYELSLAEDETIRFRDEIRPGCSGFVVEIVVTKLTDRALDLVLAVAGAANCALISSTGKDVRLLRDATDPLVKERWPGVPVVRSRDELRTWLEDVIKARPVRVR